MPRTPKIKLLPHERLLLKDLTKRLPVEAFVDLYFSRGLYFSVAGQALGVEPHITQNLHLRAHISGEDGPGFEWKGHKLQEGVLALYGWMDRRRQLTVAVVPKALNAAPPLALKEAAL